MARAPAVRAAVQVMSPPPRAAEAAAAAAERAGWVRRWRAAFNTQRKHTAATVREGKATERITTEDTGALNPGAAGFISSWQVVEKLQAAKEKLGGNR